MWDLIVSVPDHCLSFYFGNVEKDRQLLWFTYIYLTLENVDSWCVVDSIVEEVAIVEEEDEEQEEEQQHDWK